MIKLDFKKTNGLIPAIIQDYKTKNVLMVGFMNEESFKKTIKTGKVWYYSRSRNKLWLKGETSGNFQIVKEIFTDCDNDTVLITVQQIGKAACHDGYESCFYKKIISGKIKIIGKKVFDPKKVYAKVK